ncbi:MAG: 1-acyl-sn-glycerol-3-phosphate acyltransferase [Bacteroidales bacterium]|nr:1-acyl-sn-glycerol-3-phosphate acyltransferase [Bacteroidales bacterium]
MGKKIQDYDGLYAFLRHYVDYVLKMSYRKVNYNGVEKVPQDGAVIYAPNHTNALMDALLILAMDRKPKVFVARADIFKNPTLAKIFTFLKIMPIMRMRDGISEVKKNDKIIEKSVDVLRDKVPFCIFPEGQHQAKHSAQPLSKGIFRIAFQAQEMMPDMPLYIVPVGLQYGNFFRFRSTINVNIGNPINVKEFLQENSSFTPQEQMNKIKDILAERMKSLIMYIPNDEFYEATYEICAASMRPQRKRLLASVPKGSIHPNLAQFEANNITCRTVARLREEDPQTAEKLLKLGREAYKMRTKQKISLSSLTSKFPFGVRFLRFLLFLITIPYCAALSILALPCVLLCKMAFKLLKDYAFRNSIRFLVNLVVWPLVLIIYSIIGFATAPWEWAMAATILITPAPLVAQEMWRLFRLEISDFKLLMNKKLRNKYAQIQKIVLNSK